MATPKTIPTGELRDAALSLVVNYTDPQGVNKRALQLHKRNTATYATMRQVHADFEHLVQFSDDYDEILQAALAAVDSERMFKAAEKIGDELRRHVNSARVIAPVYYPEATAPALAFLDGELEKVMETVREQEAALDGVADARTALRGGGASQDAWAVLEEQADRYEQIREAQRHITVTLGDADGRAHRIEALGQSGHLKAAFDHEPSWIHARVTAYRTGGRGLERGEDAFIAWVKDAPHASFDRDSRYTFPDDPIAYLRWVSDERKAWVPDVDQLLRIHETAEDMLSHLSVKDRLDRKVTYYDDRGLAPEPGRGSFTTTSGAIRGGSFE